MSFRKIFTFIQFLIRNKIPIIVLSILSLVIFDLLRSNFNSAVMDKVSFLTLIPFLILTFYFGLWVMQLPFQNKKWLIIMMLIISMLLEFSVPSGDINILLRLIQILLLIPIFIGWVYLFAIAIAAQPEESYPTFKKFIKKFKV